MPCCVSFPLLRSALICIRGSPSAFTSTSKVKDDVSLVAAAQSLLQLHLLDLSSVYHSLEIKCGLSLSVPVPSTLLI